MNIKYNASNYICGYDDVARWLPDNTYRNVCARIRNSIGGWRMDGTSEPSMRSAKNCVNLKFIWCDLSHLRLSAVSAPCSGLNIFRNDFFFFFELWVADAMPIDYDCLFNS